MEIDKRNLGGKLSVKTTTNLFIKTLEEERQRVWIFFDTETLGFNSHKHQLTEIGAIVVDMRNPRHPIVIDSYREKSRLLSMTRLRMCYPFEGKGMSYTDIMSMTRYGESPGTFQYINEDELISGFLEFTSKYDDPLLIAHNASFDMKYVSVRAAKYGMRMDRYDVMDTYNVAKLYLKPLIKTGAAAGEEYYINLSGTLAGKRDLSIRLGHLAKAFGVESDQWHSAIADVYMLMGVLTGMISLFEDESERDITKFFSGEARKKHRRRRRKYRKEKGIRRYKRMVALQTKA